MSLLLWVVTVVVVIAAALRSTWSPCGLSMLSTITPLAEAGRGRRYASTAGWFVAGATLGGAALGVIGSIGARLVDALDLTLEDRVAVSLVLIAVAVGVDAGVVAPRLPHHRRQVNEIWLDQFRGWVYGLGFGAQIGFGLVTYIMTAAVYLVVALGALGSSPAAAFGLGVTFGLARGLVLFAGVRVTSPDRLITLHRGIEARSERSRCAMLMVEVVAAVLFATQTARPAIAVAALGLVVAGVWVIGRSSEAERSADHLLHDLRGAAVDGGDPSVAIRP